VERNSHFSAETDTGPARLVKCAQCGLVYIDPAPTPVSIREFYNSVYLTPGYRKIDGASIPDPKQEFLVTFPEMEKHLDEIEEHKQPPGRLLDVGCSHGALLLEAATRGWAAEGIEPFADGVKFCRDSLGLNVVQGDFPACEPPGGAYDVVTMYEMIEHVCDPVGAMKRAAALVKSDAILVLTSPNADSPAALVLRGNWIGLKFPTHLQFFNFYSVRRLLLSAGWSPVKVKSGGAYPGQLLAVARRMAG
jgi:SAM-dependent methyltransferase